MQWAGDGTGMGQEWARDRTGMGWDDRGGFHADGIQIHLPTDSCVMSPLAFLFI